MARRFRAAHDCCETEKLLLNIQAPDMTSSGDPAYYKGPGAPGSAPAIASDPAIHTDAQQVRHRRFAATLRY